MLFNLAVWANETYKKGLRPISELPSDKIKDGGLAHKALGDVFSYVGHAVVIWIVTRGLERSVAWTEAAMDVAMKKKGWVE